MTGGSEIISQCTQRGKTHSQEERIPVPQLPSPRVAARSFKLRGFFPPPEKMCVLCIEIAEAFWLPHVPQDILLKVSAPIARLYFGAPLLIALDTRHLHSTKASELPIEGHTNQDLNFLPTAVEDFPSPGNL